MMNLKRAKGALCILGAALLLSACAQKDVIDTTPVPEVSKSVEQTFPEGDPAGQMPEKTASLSMLDILDASCAPNSIAVMADGAFLVTDTFNKRIWRVGEKAGEVFAGGETVIGVYGEPTGGYRDAAPLTSYFMRPWAVAQFLDGWAVSDTDNNAIRLVREGEVRTLHLKTAEGSGAALTLERPTGLAVDGEGNLYIADTGNGAVRKVSPDGTAVTEAEGLRDPMGLCWQDGVLYIAETGANRIVKLEDGNIRVVAGSGEEGLADGPAAQAAFAAPRGVAVGEDGALYVADTLNSAIRRIRDGQVETVVSRDMAKAEFGLISPTGLLAAGERIYICDNFSRKLFVLEWK